MRLTPMKDFFISYNKADRTWAEWIAWTLEEAGYSVVIQAWDFRPGENFPVRMQEAAKDTRHTIAVLSEDYLAALFTQAEWAAAFARDPKGEQRTLIPVRVNECEPEGILGLTIYIDLVGRSEEDAREELLEGVLKDRAKPDSAPAFPTSQSARPSDAGRVMPKPVQYPGAFTRDEGDSSKTTIPSNLPTGIPYFTGREEVLTQLHEALKASGATALAQRQAISGLGGIGKTQTAIEYAHRHRSEYKALLWAVAESKESLISDFVAIAGVLNLPEANVQDQTFVVKAVKRWLETNSGWLLILDNADDPGIIEDFFPENSSGHLLLTSRAQVFDTVGILNPVELEEMTPEDARDFLLRRTGRNDLAKDEAQAVEQLAKELDYLPLALEQAGAYIKELRGSFQDYMASYRERGLELLEKGHSTGYRKSVRTTWSLNFQQVEQASVASADLLRASAFLSPDRIPAELIAQGALELGPELSKALAKVDVDPLVLDEVFQPLIQYSLIHRDRASRTYDIHRLVQAVLKDVMDEPTRRLWTERVVRALTRVFPDVDAIDISAWPLIERLLAHGQSCAELIKGWNLESQEASQLLNLAGRYLHLRGRLRETETLYDKAVTIREKILGPNDLDVATSLHNRAWLYLDQGKYAEAEPLFLRALEIRRSLLGPNHESVANSFRKLGHVYQELGRFTDAERTLRRALEIAENVLGADHLETANFLSALGGFYLVVRKDAPAASLLQRALLLKEKTYGPSDYRLADNVNDLGISYERQRKVGEAESLYLRALSIYESAFGANYPMLALAQVNLGLLYLDLDRYEEAEGLFTQGLRTLEAGLGSEHPDTAAPLMGLASLYRRQGKYGESEHVCLRSLSLRERTLGINHPDVASCLVEMGRLYRDQRKYSKGEPLLRRAMPILNKAFGVESTDVANAIFVLAALLKGMNRKGEAQKLEAQARKIEHKLNKKPKK